MTPERLDRLRDVSARRQLDLTVVLENVHDPHNVSAVMRTCDAVGISKIHLVNTDLRLQEAVEERLGHKSSAGARKWIDVQVFSDVEEAVDYLRTHYQSILCAALDDAAVDLYQIDMKRSRALVFGNEHDGVSQDFIALSDGCFTIPQVGMVQSLNISVACAVTLYECFRQRRANALQEPRSSPEHDALLQTYLDIHEGRFSFIPEDRE